MWFTKISLKNPVLATMMMLALVVLGVFSLQRLQVDQFPDVDYPFVIISTQYPGASPATVESEVTDKIEAAVNSVAGLRWLTSRSTEGLSLIVAEFQLQVDKRKALEGVRDKVSQIQSQLRAEVKIPVVQQFDPDSTPIWSVAVIPGSTPSGGHAMSATEITDWADQVLRKRLENVNGVGAVNLVGGAQ
ncbi:MAG: efflux RND transporter permease subunit, partial [Burkholderiaceae bacterium]|nr:efflux RND transporter permease subunit [Burkholderiaceae bacterium]